jgi:hypothetical protein
MWITKSITKVNLQSLISKKVRNRRVCWKMKLLMVLPFDNSPVHNEPLYFNEEGESGVGRYATAFCV